MNLIQYFSERPQKVLLVDGIVALVASVFLLGVAYLQVNHRSRRDSYQIE